MFEVARASKVAWRLSAVLMIGAAVSACSSVPDWVNPGTWIGSSDSQTASTDTQATADQGTTGTPASSGQTVAEASDQYPALADTPDKAPPSTSTDEQKQVAGALVADRTQAQYSAEALRGGTEPAAAPPGAAPAESAALPPPPVSSASTSAAPGDQAGTDVNANPDATPAQAASVAPSVPAMPGTLPAQASPPAATPPATQVASIAPSATAPAAATVPATAQIAPTDAALGFQPSHAPPLDPQVAQLMVPGSSHARERRMAAVTPAAIRGPATSGPTGAPAAVVSFAQDTATLDDAARAQVRAALEAYRAAGRQGYVRVVGHAASSGNSEQQLVSAVSRSQACADAVARELIKQGVPASRLLVDAVGDSGGASGRRAEIFLQS